MQQEDFNQTDCARGCPDSKLHRANPLTLPVWRLEGHSGQIHYGYQRQCCVPRLPARSQKSRSCTVATPLEHIHPSLHQSFHRYLRGMGRQDEITRQDMSASAIDWPCEKQREVCACAAYAELLWEIYLSTILRPQDSGVCVPTRHTAFDHRPEGPRMIGSDRSERVECCDLGQELVYHDLGNCTD